MVMVITQKKRKISGVFFIKNKIISKNYILQTPIIHFKFIIL